MADLDKYYAPKEMNKYRSATLGIGGIALIVWAVGTYMQPEQGLRSWLFGFISWAGICIGGLGLLMLQYMTGGAWGIVIRRITEAASRTLPLIVLMFVPIAIGVYNHTFYEFTHLSPDDPVMVHRGVFMAPWFWIVRSVCYFLIFGLMVYLLNKWGGEQDKAADLAGAARSMDISSRFSGPMTVIYSVIVTFAVVDWVMMLDPHWFSTMWGLLFVAGWALSALSFCVMVLAYLADKRPMDAVLTTRHFHDLGKLMLALVMVWAYFNFSQFLIIWAGNIPEETSWYLVRMKGGWGWIGTILILFHFAFPFVILLQQEFKRGAQRLALLGAFLLLMRFVDMFYQIAPTPRVTPGIPDGAFIVSWLDFVAPIAVGGIWLWFFIGQLMKRPIVPVNDPFYERAVAHGRAH